jgi:HK97 family phage major capsid protein
MLAKIRLLQDYQGFAAGDICEVAEDMVETLTAAGIAVRYDEEAERKAAEERERERRELVQQTLAAVRQELRGSDGPRVTAIRDREDPTAGFKSLGDFAWSVVRYTTGDKSDSRLLKWATKAAESGLSEGIDSEGGFLVPEEFAQDLLQKTYESAGVVQRCRQIEMSTKSIRIPYVKETSRVDGSRFGGIAAYRANELSGLTASKPSFGAVRLELEKLYVFVAASDELLEDAAAMGSLIASAAAQELAYKMDDEVINGTGAGQPLGILNAPCTVTVSKESGQSAATIVAANIVKMWSRCWGPSRSRAVWLINQDVEPQLYQMVIPAGTSGVPAYLPANGLAGQPYGTLFGRPVIPCESCPSLGTKGDIILADLTEYLYARHVSGVQAATSIHLKFDYDQTVFRFTVRTDGEPWWPAPLTPAKGSNTLSPFVVLETRS